MAVLAMCNSAALTNVSSSASSQSLVVGRTDATFDRVGMIVHNDSTAVLYLKYGTTATSTSYTFQIPAGIHWVMTEPIYQGPIDGIWASANGSARITELL